jgi:hypothetical protein
MGSFGGTYFRPIRSGVTQQSYKNVHKEFPDEWFEGLNIAKEVISSKYDIELNRYKVKSGTDLADWEKSGWISALGKHIYICHIFECHILLSQYICVYAIYTYIYIYLCYSYTNTKLTKFALCETTAQSQLLTVDSM